jgi:hypothetical protein
MSEKNIKSFIDELIKEVEDELDEANVTGNVDGYDTPHAFSGKNSDKKRKKTATQFGYTLVNNDINNIDESVNEAKFKSPDYIISTTPASSLPAQKLGHADVMIGLKLAEKLKNYTLHVRHYKLVHADGKVALKLTPEGKTAVRVRTEDDPKYLQLIQNTVNDVVADFVSKLKESVNEAEMNPVKKVVNAILKKHGVNAMKTTSTSVRGFHNIVNNGYSYDGNNFLRFYKVSPDVVEKVADEIQKAGVRVYGVNKSGTIRGDFSKTGLNEAALQKGKTYGGSKCEGGCFIGKEGLKKIIKISKDSPKDVFMFRDDNYSGLQPHFIKDGVIARANTINPAYDLEKNKVRSLNIDKDVILSVRLFVSTNESVNEVILNEDTKRVNILGIDFNISEMNGRIFFSFIDKKAASIKIREIGTNKIVNLIQNSLDKAYGKGEFFFKGGDHAEFQNGYLFQRSIGNIKLNKLKFESLDPKAEKFLDAIQVNDRSIKDLKNITVDATPQGNWSVYYKGKRMFTLNSKMLDDKTIMKYGLEHMDESLSEGKKIQRPVNRWLELKNDESMHANKKLATGLRELKYQLKEVETFFRWYNQIKTMNELSSDTFWKRTHGHIYKIKERLINIAKTIQEIEK